MNTATLQAPESETLECCPVCRAVELGSLPLPGHWIGEDVFGDLRGRIGLVRCKCCGLDFTNPRPSQARLDQYYSGSTYVCHETDGSAGARAKADFILDRLQKYLPADAPRTLLDFGAGGGGFLLHARSRGWVVHGFEPGRRGFEACRAAGLDVVSDLGELPKNQFGLITMNHVFEHLANPAELLGVVRSLLAPGGRLFIEVPNARSLRARLAAPYLSRSAGVDERYRAFPIHLAYYHQQTLRRVLENEGWSVDQAFTMGLGLDEFFARAPRSDAQERPARTPGAHGSRPQPRLRHRLRDAFLSLGLGENLAVISSPAN